MSTQEDKKASSHLFSALHKKTFGHFHAGEWEILHK